MDRASVNDRSAEWDAIERCRRGDPEGLRLVFEAYKDRVYSIAFHFLRGDEAGAKDVTQQVFVKLFRCAGTFRGEARVSTWLYRIVANACLDELRRRRRLVLFGSTPAFVESVATAPSAEPSDRETVLEIRAAVGRLSPKLRLTVLLRYFDDLSYDDIAQALGCSPGSVASRLNRAHAILGRQLAHLRGESLKEYP